METVKEEIKHSPLPWAFTKDEKNMMISVHVEGADISDDTKDQTCCGLWGEHGGKEIANAELIVTAVNSHYTLTEQNAKLKKLLRECLPAVEHCHDQAKKNGSHQEFLDEDRQLLREIRQSLLEQK